MTIAAPLDLTREVVRPEWIDYNGHMNVANYLEVFDHATDDFLDYIGLDRSYRAQRGATTFAVECHVTYQREITKGEPLRIATQLLGFDEKRIHLFQMMSHADQDFLAATCEWLSLHVDANKRQVAPMAPEILARLAEIGTAHQSLPRPPEVGRVIRMGSKR